MRIYYTIPVRNVKTILPHAGGASVPEGPRRGAPVALSRYTYPSHKGVSVPAPPSADSSREGQRYRGPEVVGKLAVKRRKKRRILTQDNGKGEKTQWRIDGRDEKRRRRKEQRKRGKRRRERDKEHSEEKESG